MASLVNDGEGLDGYNRWRIIFVGADGARKPIRMRPGTTETQAQAVKLNVEALVAAQIADHPPDQKVTRWLAKCEQELHDKLVKADSHSLASARR